MEVLRTPVKNVKILINSYLAKFCNINLQFFILKFCWVWVFAWANGLCFVWCLILPLLLLFRHLSRGVYRKGALPPSQVSILVPRWYLAQIEAEHPPSPWRNSWLRPWSWVIKLTIGSTLHKRQLSAPPLERFLITPLKLSNKTDNWAPLLNPEHKQIVLNKY